MFSSAADYFLFFYTCGVLCRLHADFFFSCVCEFVFSSYAGVFVFAYVCTCCFRMRVYFLLRLPVDFVFVSDLCFRIKVIFFRLQVGLFFVCMRFFGMQVDVAFGCRFMNLLYIGEFVFRM